METKKPHQLPTPLQMPTPTEPATEAAFAWKFLTYKYAGWILSAILTLFLSIIVFNPSVPRWIIELL